jgi:hypothetical protein
MVLGVPNERGRNIDGLMKIASPDEWRQDRVGRRHRLSSDATVANYIFVSRIVVTRQ